MNLETLREEIENWRKTRISKRGRIPLEIWEKAVKLCEVHRIQDVAKKLNIQSNDLRKKIKNINAPLSHSANTRNKQKNFKHPSFIQIPNELNKNVISFSSVEIDFSEGFKIRICK